MNDSSQVKKDVNEKFQAEKGEYVLIIFKFNWHSSSILSRKESPQASHQSIALAKPAKTKEQKAHLLGSYY